MSLPTAPKDISDKPKAGSVTDPVNKNMKDADIDRKLRFYGVIQAFREGRLPDNRQIDETLSYVQGHSFVDTDALSAEGQRLIQDVRDIIETARTMVKQKNADELFQNFIWHTRDTDVSQAKPDASDIITIDQDKLKKDGRTAVQHLRTLLTLVLTNSEARKLFSDFAIIGRDMFATGAAKVAEIARPPAERMKQVDDPAPPDQFVTEGGNRITAHAGDAPVLEANIPNPVTGHENGWTIKQHPNNEFGAGAEIHGPGPDGQGVRTGADAKEHAISQVTGLAAEGAKRVKDDQQNLLSDVDKTDDSDQKKDITKSGFRDRLNGMKDNIMAKVPQEHKDKANDHYERVKKVLTEEYFPEERRDQFIYRAKKVIVECQKHDDYQSSIKWLLDFLEEYASHAKNTGSKCAESHGILKDDSQLTLAFTELRTLLERFANGKSFSDITERVQVLYDDANQDEQLRDWFKQVDAWARKCLLEPGYVLNDDCSAEGSRLRDSGREFYDGKYKSHFDAVFTSIGDFFTAMADDPLNARFGQDWARLTRDLLFDNEGSLKYKPELWNDIRKVIIPSIIDRVGYIPIPRVEYTDDSLDLVLENLTLSGRNLFPNLVSIEAHNFIKFSPYDSISDDFHHEFTIHFAQVQADMRDVAFYFKKKTGMPKIQDSGLADFIVGGNGLSATIHLVSAGKDKTSVFNVKNVNVKVDSLKFSIRDSKHDTLYNTLRPLATGLVKKQIQKALQDAITTGLEYIDGQLVGVRDRMSEAKESDEGSRLKVLQELFQSKKTDAASAKPTTNSQFKVVAKRDSAILQGQGHPAGWVNRQQERADTAKQGSEWRSEAFTIV